MQVALSLFHKSLDFLIPLRCIKCGGILEESEGLCSSCWPSVSFVSKPYCSCCGRPFDFEIEDEALCGPCAQSTPAFRSARSVFVYTSESKDLILKFKHTDNIQSAPLFGKWMSQRMELLENPLCIPVPLHWTRLFMRTYNQAALLAQAISKLKKFTYAPRVLIRHRRTPSQGKLSKDQRVTNVKRAFSVSKKHEPMIKSRNILLIDDVFTTGATLNACAKVLMKAGAKSVHALTLARVVIPHQT
jgi:ComF family protein